MRSKAIFFLAVVMAFVYGIISLLVSEHVKGKAYVILTLGASVAFIALLIRKYVIKRRLTPEERSRRDAHRRTLARLERERQSPPGRTKLS